MRGRPLPSSGQNRLDRYRQHHSCVLRRVWQRCNIIPLNLMLNRPVSDDRFELLSMNIVIVYLLSLKSVWYFFTYFGMCLLLTTITIDGKRMDEVYDGARVPRRFLFTLTLKADGLYLCRREQTLAESAPF